MLHKWLELQPVSASRANEVPIITQDPLLNNYDVYRGRGIWVRKNVLD